MLLLRGINVLKLEETISKCSLPFSKYRSMQGGMCIFQLNTNAFRLELTPFQKGLDVQESEQEVTCCLPCAKW